MMPKTVIIVIFSFLVNVINGQTIDETFRFAEKQFESGNFQSALTEYQRVAFFDSKNHYNEGFYRIGDLFFATGDYFAAIRNYDIAYRTATNDSLKRIIILKKALCFFKQDHYFFALNELLALPSLPNGSAEITSILYEGIARFGTEQYDQAYLSFISIMPDHVEELETLFERLEKIRKRYNPGKIEMMSIIFPGLGQIYCGNIVGGINSLALTGGFAVVAILVWQTYGIFDALLSVSSWYYRYYTGGIQNAKSVARMKISVEREKVYNEIIRLLESDTPLPL